MVMSFMAGNTAIWTYRAGISTGSSSYLELDLKLAAWSNMARGSCHAVVDVEGSQSVRARIQNEKNKIECDQKNDKGRNIEQFRKNC